MDAKSRKGKTASVSSASWICTLPRKRGVFTKLRFLAPGLTACLLAVAALAQTPSAPENAGTVLRLRVRVKVGDSTRGLSRKRFFLIKGSLEQNKPIVETIERRTPTSRNCFYRRAGATEALIKWLKDNDCESVYCREIQSEDLEGSAAVPEFVTALAAGEKNSEP